MSLISRTRRAIAHARTEAPVLGWGWILREKYLRRIGVEEVNLKPPGLPHPVVCRVVSSDIYEYTHSLGRGRKPFNLPITPKFIVDAGSNVGYSVLRFHSDFPDAKIVGIEPESKNVIQFKKNCAPYSNISIEHAALWPRSTKLRFKRLDANTNAFQVTEDDAGDITAISINEVMRRHDIPRIDLLKIDIEGGEKTLFDDPNVKDWLKHVGAMLIETHERYAPGCVDSIKRAVEDSFDFRGEVGEYSFYIQRAAQLLNC